MKERKKIQVGPTLESNSILKFIFGPKKFWDEKSLGPKMFWVQKSFGLKEVLGQKKVLVQKIKGPKTFWVRKNFSQKKYFELKTIFGPTKFRVQKNFWVHQTPSRQFPYTFLPSFLWENKVFKICVWISVFRRKKTVCKSVTWFTSYANSPIQENSCVLATHQQGLFTQPAVAWAGSLAEPQLRIYYHRWGGVDGWTKYNVRLSSVS